MKLKLYREPEPKPRKGCAACNTFAPECVVPIGDASAPMCWLCAHHVVEHNAPVSEAYRAECECLPKDIYPHRVLESTEPALAPDPPPPNDRAADREQLLNGPPERLKAWVREAHKQMSLAQHAAVKRRVS